MSSRIIRVVVAGAAAALLLAPAAAWAKPLGSWKLAGVTTEPLVSPRLITVPSGDVVAVDSEGGHEVYDPTTNKWTATSDPPTSIGRGFTATKTADGKVFVTAGGGDNLAETYDPASDSWTSATSSTFGHEGGYAARLSDGEILVAGGDNCVSNSCSSTTESELYNPKTDTWRPTGAMISSVFGATMVSLRNGDVMVLGGEGDTTNCGMRLGCPQIYHAPTGKWRLAAGMLSEQLFCAAVTLNSGKVLAIGGLGGGGLLMAHVHRHADDLSGPRPLKLAEIYDPNLDSWKLTTKMQFSRGTPLIYLFITEGGPSATATVLPNGRVLVTGGSNLTNIIDRAEIYDPASKKWLDGGVMPEPRVVSSATRLRNGRVLVAGGANLYSNVEQADLYRP